MAQIQDGSQGPLVAEVACVRAVAVRDGLPGPDVWVVLRRALDASRELKGYLCNAAADTPPATLVWLRGLRWPVEQAIKEAKEELGLDHDAVRGWVGWHHHTAMTLLAHHFLVRLRGRLGGNHPGADGAPGPAPPQRDAPRPPARRGGAARLNPGGANGATTPRRAPIASVACANFACSRTPLDPTHVVKLGRCGHRLRCTVGLEWGETPSAWRARPRSILRAGGAAGHRPPSRAVARVCPFAGEQAGSRHPHARGRNVRNCAHSLPATHTDEAPPRARGESAPPF